jgi:ribosomal protein S18 acetylase RimI-like enzyme
MTIEIVALSSGNTSLLERIGLDVFDNAIDQQQLAKFVADPRHVMILALDAGVVVGMASAVEYFHPDKQPQMWINEVGVASTHRLQGIGKELTACLVREAKSRGCDYVWLGTDEANRAGKACFGTVPGVRSAQPFLMYEWELGG